MTHMKKRFNTNNDSVMRFGTYKMFPAQIFINFVHDLHFVKYCQGQRGNVHNFACFGMHGQ